MNFFKNFSVLSFLAYSKFGMQVLGVTTEILAYILVISLVFFTMNKQYEHTERIAKLEQSCLSEQDVQTLISESQNHFYISGEIKIADPSEPSYEIPILMYGDVAIVPIKNDELLSLDF